MAPDSKLYIILRATLSAGLKTAQTAHAAFAFQKEHPELQADWFESSNNICVLEYDDLDDLAERLENHGLALARFREPDQDNALTAICVEPRARKQVARLPLACAA